MNRTAHRPPGAAPEHGNLFRGIRAALLRFARSLSRATTKYLLLLALATLVFFWKTLLTSQFTTIIGSEGVNLTYAWLHFWVRSIWQGHIPLWDPYAFAGRPFSGEMVPSGFNPLHLIFALFPLNRNAMISPRL